MKGDRVEVEREVVWNRDIEEKDQKRIWGRWRHRDNRRKRCREDEEDADLTKKTKM